MQIETWEKQLQYAIPLQLTWFPLGIFPSRRHGQDTGHWNYEKYHQKFVQKILELSPFESGRSYSL